MAAKITVQLIDDIDGSVASETIQFAVDGVQYEIDLSDDHAHELRDSMNRWVRGARKLGKAAVAAPARKAGATGGDTTLIRAWAKANGYVISDRGRVSSDIREAYAKAH